MTVGNTMRRLGTENNEQQRQVDAALGCMIGAFVGDAAGAVLEFKPKRSITPEAVDQAMLMPGGGVFGVGRGQITDDSELALCLADGLCTASPDQGFPADAVAERYRAWFRSSPFDIGNTCRTAFGAHLSGPPDETCGTDGNDNQGSGSSLAQRMRQAARASLGSKANGHLMRATPLAVWGRRLPDDALARAVAGDACLSHPNPACIDAGAAYCIAIKHLINQPGDAEGAAAAAEAWAAAAPACEEVREWLEEARSAAATGGPGPRCDASIGFARWGFVHAFRLLLRRAGFREGLKEVLLMGGDTDTNAAIVGGVLGALHGAADIPQEMKGPVLARGTAGPTSLSPCDEASTEVNEMSVVTGLDGVPRPAFLQSCRVPGLVTRLWQLGEPAGDF